MDYNARKTKDGRKQALSDHLRGVARDAKKHGAKFDVANVASLIGLLHDLGKYSAAFQTYLKSETSKRGSIIHSTQGARYIVEKANELGASSLTAQIIAFCIAGHHSGLPDGISPSYGETPLLNRIGNNNPKLNYDEVVSAFEKCESIELSKLLRRCDSEIEAFTQKCQENKLNKDFALHLLVKALFSALIDADRYDAYRFETRIDQ